MSEVARLVARAAEQGKRTHAAWDSEVYARIATEPATLLWQAMAAPEGRAQGHGPDQGLASPAVKVIDGYLLLLGEALVTGYLELAFVRHVLIERVPADLASVAPAQRLAVLAATWNLCEGLAREPSWLGQFVFTRVEDLRSIERLAEFLVRALEPALEPAPAVAWRSPYRVTVLDARTIEDDFLPGELTLCAPQVVAVKDRRRDRYMALLFRRGGKSQLFGPLDTVDAYRDAASPVQVSFGRSQVTIAEHTAALPRFGEALYSLVAQAGFSVAAAADSQRLWIIESAT